MNRKTILRFFEFYRTHPEVYEWVVDKLRRLQARGWTFHSVKACYDDCRFNIALEKGPDEEFCLDDRFQSLYARLIYASCPDLRGFFEMRELKWDSLEAEREFDQWVMQEQYRLQGGGSTDLTPVLANLEF